MNYKEFTEKLREWQQYPNYHKKFIVVVGGKKMQKRLFYSQNGYICEYKKGSTRRGYHIDFSIGDVTDFYPANNAVDKAKKLQHACKRAADIIEKSRLWLDLLPAFKAVRDAEYEDVKALADAGYADTTKWFADKGLERGLSSDEVYGLMTKGIVNIPYDKDERDFIKGMAREAIKDASEYHHYWRGSYDYRICIEPQKDGILRAWYSAEYKNCGNGHYYLMIDESHAFHCEDD